MKFIVMSADDYTMTQINYYEEYFGLKLYEHFEEDEGYIECNEETNIFYLEIETLFELQQFINKTRKQKIIIKHDIDNYYLEQVISKEILNKEFDGIIIDYNYFVE